jgi:hypothetical protein
MNKQLTLSIMPETLAVCRLEADSQIPEWGLRSEFFSITKTSDELSIVCNQEDLPADVQAERDWRAFKVEGPLDFSLTGILAQMSTALADDKISIFAISTFDTDYILVKASTFQNASDSLAKICNITQ